MAEHHFSKVDTRVRFPSPAHCLVRLLRSKGETGASRLMYTVYVLKSLTDDRTYVGCTKDLENRIKEHNAGEVKSTKTRIPFVLWYREEYLDKYRSFKREQHFKTAWGRRQLRKILDNLQK